MTDLHFDVPVVAHRLYGTRYVERLSRISRRAPDFHGTGRLIEVRTEDGPLTLRFPSTRPVLYPAIDRAHGTTISLEAVRAIFTGDPEVAGSEDMNANSYWGPMGIRFVLLGIVDDAIDSSFADFVPNDGRYYDELFEPIMRKGRVSRQAIHILFVRNLEGKAGTASAGSKYKAPRILLEDFWSIPDETPGQTWARWMATVAHELGHALNLPHMDDRDNLMWFSQTRSRLQIRRTQMRIAHGSASSYSVPPGVPAVAPYLGLEEEFRVRI